jgi:mRNA interferase HigB
MRIITVKRLESFWSHSKWADSMQPLLEWIEDVRLAAWETPVDVKETFGKRVDFVKSRKTGTTLVVFDIAGNKYRLIAAIHYLKIRPMKGRVYVLKIMAHKEYDENKWKDNF